MQGSKYLSELITDSDTILPGRINIIEANTSGGKTWFALNTLPQWAGSPEKVLYLIDTSNGEFRLQQNILAVSRQTYALADYCSGKVWGEFAHDADGKMPVMTYAGFGAEVRKCRCPFWQKFDFIVCDEMQNLVKYHSFKGSKIHLEAAEMTLRNIAIEGKTKIVALTATPQKVREHFGSLCRSVPFDRASLISYDTFQTETYTGIESILLQSAGKTGILYTEQVEPMKKYIAFAREHSIMADGFWSLNCDTPMTEEQKALRQKVLADETIPDHLDLLVINAASETCIKIQEKNRKVDYMIIHIANEDTRIQVRGRYCGDLPTLYLHDAAIDPANVEVPPQFIGKKLFSKEKEALCQALNLRAPNNELYKWRKVKAILAAGNYTVQDGREKNLRYALILPKQVGSIL